MQIVNKRMETFATKPSRQVSLVGVVAVLVALTALPQIYLIHVFGTYLPLHVFFCYALAAFIRPTKGAVTLFLGLYTFYVLFSGVWAVDKGTWANAALFTPLFAIGFMWARAEVNRNLLYRFISIFVFVGAINAVLIIIFRFVPELEASYLQSYLINVFKNPDRVRGFVQFRPNVYDVMKSGGIFDNGNTAATFSLLCIGCAISIRRYINGASKLLIALFVFSVYCSGSKSALIILIIVGALVATRRIFTIARGSAGAVALLAFVMIASFVSLQVTSWLGPYLSSSFAKEVTETSSFRLSLWRIALGEFPEHPIFGLGFGGWSTAVASKAGYYGVQAYWPPHNSIVSAWSDTGIIGVVCLVGLWLTLVGSLLRSQSFREHRSQGAGALFALLSVSAMSLGDPMPLLGAQNMSVALGVLIALCLNSDRNETYKPA